jgi:hypothetical protein
MERVLLFCLVTRVFFRWQIEKIQTGRQTTLQRPPPAACQANRFLHLTESPMRTMTGMLMLAILSAGIAHAQPPH